MADLVKAAYLALGVFMLTASVSLGIAVSAEMRRRFALELAEDLALTLRLVNSTRVSVEYRLPEPSEISLAGGFSYAVRIAGGIVEVLYDGVDWSSFPPRLCEHRVAVSCGVYVTGAAELPAGSIVVLEPSSRGVFVGGCG